MFIRSSCAEQYPGIGFRGCRLVLEPGRRGGTTTLAIHLATVLAERGSVPRGDADHQGFAPGWRAQPQPPAEYPVVGSPKPTLRRDTGALGENRDWALVAGSPRGAALSRSAVAASDLVLIPGRPSLFDLCAARDILDILEDCSVVRPGLRARLVVLGPQRSCALEQASQRQLRQRHLPPVLSPTKKWPTCSPGGASERPASCAWATGPGESRASRSSRADRPAGTAQPGPAGARRTGRK